MLFCASFVRILLQTSDRVILQSAQPPNTTGYHVTNGHAPPGDLSQQQGMNQQPSRLPISCCARLLKQTF